MRVIAGKAKGHKLKTIEGLQTRPTTDRMKETLFNVIAFDLLQCRFLDLFSGSGAIGIEALSRGAKECVFVEKSKEACHIIDENLKHTKLKNAVVLQKDVFDALLLLKQQKFDMIFLDPPYQSDLAVSVCHKIVEYDLLEKQGYVIWERSAEIKIPFISGLTIVKEKKSKTTVITFLTLEEEYDKSNLCREF